ncbi:tRNA preQ1(34) S-adenosylmethionine ribosyltransferase-isomerase QueA [bacterium]|nr:tRNA preQ1(34) S-adenosylmethionine ribosyltransferase-isomerase QueA [bacterium]
MDLDRYDYELPPDLIAQRPAIERDKSRLLVLGPAGERQHTFFEAIQTYFQADDMLIINETKVSSFCLEGRKAGTDTPVSCLISGVLDPVRQVYQAIAKPLRRLKPGTRISFGESVLGTVLQRDRYTCMLQFQSLDPACPLEKGLMNIARPPLPPYISRQDANDTRIAEDWVRYQTVYARAAGSLAAPTAGLHFTGQLLNTLARIGVWIVPLELQIGAGTFRPIKVADIRQHQMEEESYAISAENWQAIMAACQQGRRVYAVGTTVIRALESIAACQDCGPVKLAGKTGLFIYPGYRFRLPYAGLITNFHLPRSTLLLLVSAFAGADTIRQAYAEAVALRYRFYSYGDAMFIRVKPPHSFGE